MSKKAIFIVGSTGVGKTQLAFYLAKKFNGALVSADSIQVYKGLDIVSGKDLPKSAKYILLPQVSSNKIQVGYYSCFNIPIFLLDIVEPTVSFSVYHFQKLSSKVIHYITKQNKLPIIVGGTGLYIGSITSTGKTFSTAPNKKLRKELEDLDIIELNNILKKLDVHKFQEMNESDVQNKRRLIRAIEVLKNKLPPINHQLRTNFDSLTIGLYCKKEILKEKIDERVAKRLKDGALDEVKDLFVDYENLSQQVKNANGYKQLFQFFKKEINIKEAIYRWKISEYHHAKNQMTWFRKYGDVIWFDIMDSNYKKEIEKLIINFLSS